MGLTMIAQAPSTATKSTTFGIERCGLDARALIDGSPPVLP